MGDLRTPEGDDALVPARHSEGRQGALNRVLEARWLLLQWVQRDFTVQYRQSVLGVVWAIVQPLMLLVFYGLVFNRVLGIEAPHGNYVVFALCGLVPWTFITSVLTRSIVSLASASYVIKQVYFPRSLIPLASTGVTTIDLLLGTAVLIGAQVVANGELHIATLALIPIFLCVLLLMAAVGVVAAVLGAFVRDLRFVLPLLIQVGFIATPVMYPRSQVPARYAWVYDANPIGRVIEAVRACVIEGRWPSFGLLAGLFVLGVLSLVVALAYSSAVEDRLPDLL